MTTDDFATRFLQKCALGKTISRYMVLVASEQKPEAAPTP